MRKLIFTIFAVLISTVPAFAQDLQYSRKLTDYTTGPKVGGFVISKYSYTDQEGKHDGDGLSQRMVRVYADGTFAGAGKADGWYVALGVPVNDWFKVYTKYDVYRDQATEESMTTMCSLAPKFQIHKNLMLQLQYNYVDYRPTSSHWNEFWAEFYFRF